MYEKMLCLSFTFWTQWNTRMQSKQVALYAVLLLPVVSAIKENDKIKSTSSRNDLKHKFGCRPNGKWNVLSLKHNAVEVICMSRDYEVENEPKEITLNPILINIENSTLVGIDEKEKTMTMDIQLAAIWSDERINAVFMESLGAVTLPSVTTEDKTNIWNPFQRLEIKNLKERRYILDPIILKIGLLTEKTANEILKGIGGKTSYPDRHSVVWSRIQWRVTVSCPFDFRRFPFDAHKCTLIMALPFNWNLTVPETKHTFKNVKDGFEIEAQELDLQKQHERLFDVDNIIFGVDIRVKRQLPMYIYQYYLPSITIVIASSVSFIIPLSAIPGRVALVGTQFLTLTNIFINLMVRRFRLLDT